MRSRYVLAGQIAWVAVWGLVAWLLGLWALAYVGAVALLVGVVLYPLCPDWRGHR